MEGLDGGRIQEGQTEIPLILFNSIQASGSDSCVPAFDSVGILGGVSH